MLSPPFTDMKPLCEGFKTNQTFLSHIFLFFLSLYQLAYRGVPRFPHVDKAGLPTWVYDILMA